LGISLLIRLRIRLIICFVLIFVIHYDLLLPTFKNLFVLP
jgi:hypothetical protein